MKTIAKKLMAIMLVVLMFSISPLCDAAPKSHAAGEDSSGGSSEDGKYISEVRIGMGETEAEAKRELESEGFTILKDESGALADLNKDAGSNSALKRGANDKIVYFGYKKTDNAYDAITDLAVMNMKGGYSVEDYNMIIDREMDTQIKPFVDNFIATLGEYRANYKKSKSSPGHIRADYMRRLMNKLTDDDTGGQPMGDLLLNKTKYELGDAAYNALSDAEKKKHCDILNLLLQANGQATLSLKKLVTRASDMSDDTWVDRFSEITLDDLIAEVEEEDPSLTTEPDIYAALDRKYHDTAELIAAKWDEFQPLIVEYEDKADELVELSEETAESVDEVSETFQDKELSDLTKEDYELKTDVEVEVGRQAYDTQVVMVATYLNTVEYDGDTMYEFFCRDQDEISTDEGIRSLYPIVASLSPGQIVGMEFLSIMELFSMAISDEETYKAVEETLADTEEASVYEGVNREIYEKGGVALTSDALRAKALETDTGKEEYSIGTLPIVFWSLTAGMAVATVVSTVVAHSATKSAQAVAQASAREIAQLTNRLSDYKATFDLLTKVKTETLPKVQNLKWVLDNHAYATTEKAVELTKELNEYQEAVKGADEGLANLKNNAANTKASIANAQGAADKATASANFAKFLSIGMAVITFIMTVVSTVMTMLDAAKFYDTEYTPIPKYIVEESDITAINAKGEQVMLKNQSAYYRVVRCNRTAGDSSITKKNFEVMGDANDLNGDIGSQWLSLYSIKYENGLPILADSLLYQINGDRVPDGYSTGIHEFGAKPACDINSAKYLFPEKTPEIKVHFKRDTSVQSAGAAGSLFTPGSLAIGGGVGLVVGAIFGGLVMSRRKKKPETAHE